MSAPQADPEPSASIDLDRRTQRLPGVGSDLEKLSISDLERLLAEKRRRESKRLMRSVAGRTSPDPLRQTSRLPPAGLATPGAPPRKSRATRRLFPEEARAALARAAMPRAGLPPPVADRFRRSSLAAPIQPRPQRGPAWIRQATVRKGIDLGLQLAEIGFVVLFLYVIAQWLFADAQTDTNIAAEMAGVLAPTAGPTPDASGTSDLDRQLGRPPPVVLPLVGPQAAGAAPRESATPTIVGPEARVPLDSEIRDSLLPDHFSARIITPLATLSQTTAPSAAPLASTTAAPRSTPTLAVEINPALPIEIRIPRIKLDARVREVEVNLATWEWEVADYMAGHHKGTANPGETGNVVIAGHRDIRGSVFLHLDQLKPGDDIYLYSGRGTFHYIVRTTKIVLPTAVQIMAPTTDQRLTLITCTPIKIASHRLVVIADLDTSYSPPDRGR